MWIQRDYIYSSFLLTKKNPFQKEQKWLYNVSKNKEATQIAQVKHKESLYQ